MYLIELIPLARTKNISDPNFSANLEPRCDFKSVLFNLLTHYYLHKDFHTSTAPSHKLSDQRLGCGFIGTRFENRSHSRYLRCFPYQKVRVKKLILQWSGRRYSRSFIGGKLSHFATEFSINDAKGGSRDGKATCCIL